MLVFLFVNYAPPMYGSYVFPDWALSIGWALALCPCSLIPITMVVMFFYKAGSCAVSKEIFYARRDYVSPCCTAALAVLYERTLL